MATLLCKLRIVRQSESKITSGALEGGLVAEGLSDHAEGATNESLRALACVFVCAMHAF